MTYAPLTSCRFGAPSIPLAATEDRDTGWRGSEDALALKWARMATREGHRRAIPSDPQAKVGGRPSQIMPLSVKMLRWLDRSGASTRKRLRKAVHPRGEDFAAVLAEMQAAGLVREEADPTRNHPRRTVLTLTDAGRARLEAL